MYMTGILAVCLTVIRLTTGTCDSKTTIDKKKSGEISINRYNDNQDCQWRFLTETNWNQLRITLTSYDITTDKNKEQCFQDVLRIGDLDICGKSETDKCYIFFKNTAHTEKCITDPGCSKPPAGNWPPKVIFESDEKDIGEGFHLTYKFKICRPYLKRGNNKTSIEGRKVNTITSTPPKKKHVKSSIGVTTYMNDLATTTTTSIEGTQTTLAIILVLGFFVLVLFAALLFIIIRRKKKSKKPDSNTTKIETNGTGEGMYATIRDVNKDSENERQSSSGYGMVNNVIYESR